MLSNKSLTDSSNQSGIKKHDTKLGLCQIDVLLPKHWTEKRYDFSVDEEKGANDLEHSHEHTHTYIHANGYKNSKVDTPSRVFFIKKH